MPRCLALASISAGVGEWRWWLCGAPCVTVVKFVAGFSRLILAACFKFGSCDLEVCVEFVYGNV